MAGERNEIIKEIHEKALIHDGREKLPCAVAFDIADAFGIGRREIGKICHEEGISIVAC
ncbi:MAG: hypothetical protein ACYC9O_06655 [Candidatus Latescibacterota bacterium]